MKMLKIGALVVAVCVFMSGCSTVKGMIKDIFGQEEASVQVGLVEDLHDGQITTKDENGIKPVFPDNGQKDTVTEAELDAFCSMTPDQLDAQYICPALRLYGIFDGGMGLEVDWEDTVTYNGFEFPKVRSQQSDLDPRVDFSKFENFRDYMYTIFSKDLTDRLLADGEGSIYVTINGDLYSQTPGRGAEISYQGYTCAVTDVSDSTVTCTVYARYIKDEYFDSMFEDGFEYSEDKTDVFPKEFTLIKQNGHWVFEDFKQWY